MHVREGSTQRKLELPARLTTMVLDETEWIVSERTLHSRVASHERPHVERIVLALEENGLLYHDHERHVLINTLPLEPQRQLRDL